jgi:hypothetical protein
MSSIIAPSTGASLGEPTGLPGMTAAPLTVPKLELQLGAAIVEPPSLLDAEGSFSLQAHSIIMRVHIDNRHKCMRAVWRRPQWAKSSMSTTTRNNKALSTAHFDRDGERGVAAFDGAFRADRQRHE